MITQTPSPNKTMPTKRREPLRWLIPAALLLLFLSICCIGQVVIVILSPRNEASNLNLLSKDMADYSPWKILLKFPPIAPGAAAAQAADRATEAAQALLSPTPLVVAKVPTSEVIVIAAPQNAPTTTPGSALITPQPTVTPRPAVLGPTNTPVIGTVPPVATPVPTLVAIVPLATDTPRLPTLTNTPISGDQPTPTNTPVSATATNTPQPADTSTPTNVVPTSTKVAPPPATDTAVPPPPATDTAVPPPPATDTAVPPPPRDTNTPLPPTTKPPPPVTQTSTPTAVPPTAVPATATNTFTLTPVPPTATPTATSTNTPTATPTPICTAVPNTLTIVKVEANGIYTQGVGQPIDFTICIFNATSLPVLIQGITDTMPNTWQWTSLTCDTFSTPNNPNIACSPPSSPTGGTFAWGHQVVGQSLIMNPGDQINLRIHGSYLAAGSQCNGPVTVPGGIGYEVTLAGNTVLAGNAACITVQ